MKRRTFWPSFIKSFFRSTYSRQRSSSNCTYETNSTLKDLVSNLPGWKKSCGSEYPKTEAVARRCTAKNLLWKGCFFIKDFFSKCDQISRKLWRKSLAWNFIFCAAPASQYSFCFPLSQLGMNFVISKKWSQTYQL